MALDNVQAPEPSDPEDLLAAWRGQVRELESLPDVEQDSGGELLTQLRAIADDLARGPAATMPLLAAVTEQAEVLSEAIANAESAPTADDAVIASPFDFAAFTTAITTLEGAASSLLARAEGEFVGVREAVTGEVLGIRETLATELKALREEFQKSHRRAARRSTDGGPRVLAAANESPLLAKLNEACGQLETLRAQTQRLAESLPQQNAPAFASPNTDERVDVTQALAQLQNFIESAVVSLRQDLDAYAASVESHATNVRRTADLSATAAEQAIAQLQARVGAAVSDADQRLARLTANVQSTVERAERSASQVEAAFAATAALRVEATGAVGNWRDEALRIVRDALSRMATETAGAANQAREARKTVIAETRTIRSEILKDAESAHAAVLAEVRRELDQTRAAFAEQRQQLSNELSALEEARRQHEQRTAESRTDVSRAVAESASATRQEVERLDAAYSELRAHLDEVRAANTRVVAAVESVEVRTGAELEALSAARGQSEALTDTLRTEIGAALAELRDARVELEEHHGSAIDSIAATHAALTDELARTLDATRVRFNESNERLSAAAETIEQRIGAVDRLDSAYHDLRKHTDEVRAANELVVNVAENIESKITAELEPLAELRRQSLELTLALRDQIGGVLAELDQTRTRVHGTDEELRAACEQLEGADAGLSAALRRVDESSERLSLAADSVEQRIQAVDRLGSAYHDLQEHLGEVRAANDRLVAAADSIEARATAELEPLASLRERSEDVVSALRVEIGKTLGGLRAAHIELEEQHRTAIGSVAETQAALHEEVGYVAATREELSAAHRDLRRHLDEVRAANELVVNVAENVESSLQAEIEPLAEVRRRSQELFVALQDQLREALRALDETRLRVGASDDDLRAASEQLARAEEQVSALRRRTEESAARLDTAADVVLHRATDVQRLHAVFSDFHASLQETREELRAANELVVHAAESVESRANAELAPLAEVRRRSAELAESFDAMMTELAPAVHAKVDAAAAALSIAALRIEEAEERINVAAESTQARVRQEIDALSSARSEYEAAIEHFRADARRALDEARAHQEHTAAALAKDFRGIAEQRRAEFSRMFDEMRGQFGAALSAIAASNAEAKADANAHVAGLAHDLRSAVEQQVRAASHEIRAELEVVVNALRDQLDRATIAEREANALRDAAESKQTREDGAALQRAVGMLSVLESLDDALQALQSEQTPEARARIDHFERQARAMAELVELEEVGVDGEVDEERHEIVGVDAKHGELGHIVDVRQRGYAFRGRVMRRAQVVVGGASTGVATRAHAAAQLSQQS